MVLNKKDTKSDVRTFEITAPANRADVAVSEKIGIPRNQVKRLMEMGLVLVGVQKLKPADRLKAGMKVCVTIPPPEPLELVPEERILDILYEDDHIAVINKPQGLTVHPSATQKSGTLVHALLHQIQDLSGIGGVLRPGIVHRLDKDTSGALVITKTDEAHRKLALAFSTHDIERVYTALCYGVPKSGNRWVRIESLLGRDPADRKRMSMKVTQGRTAITEYRVQKAYRVSSKPPFASLVEVRLETGRTHQIRVHLTGSGHSVLADPVYGKPSERQAKWLLLPPEVQEKISSLKGQLLHAGVLGFMHPITGERLRFVAPPPPEFQDTLRLLDPYTEV